MTEEAESKPEEQSRPNSKEEKPLRRIAERSEPPTDKSELIKYLTERIQQAEDALNDTEELLENETNERENLKKSIVQRNEQMERLYQIDQKALPQKIKEKLTEILTETITQKMVAEEALQEAKQTTYEYKTRYAEMKRQETEYKHTVEKQSEKINELNELLNSSEERNKDEAKTIQELENSIAEINEKKNAVEDKYFQMKVALDRMGDIRTVLNRFFTNDHLFDEKMILKEQKIIKPQESSLIKDRIPSREGQSNSGINNAQLKLKPINFVPRNDDEDFWKGDFSIKTRNGH